MASASTSRPTRCALRALGVLDEILEAGFQYDRNTFFDWQGQLIVDCPSALGGDVPANNALTRPRPAPRC
jgi:hypothetical protein